MAYEFWDEALAGKGPEVHADHPQEGKYRYRRGKAWIPVAIWPVIEGKGARQGGEITGQKGFADNAEDLDRDALCEIWLACAKYPVENEPYFQAYDTGRWHDDAPEAPRGIGDNLPEEPVEQIRVELAGEAEIVEEFLKTPVTTQAQADQVGPWVKRIREIVQRVERLHDEEKRPFLEGGRAVDEKWRFPMAKAKELVKRLLGASQPFLDEQDRLARERARAAAAETQRLRDEAAQQKGQAEREELERRAAEAAKETVVENASAGRVGAKVSLRREKRAEIFDYDVLLLALKDKPEVREAVDKLAQRAAHSGFELPGMKIVEITKAA